MFRLAPGHHLYELGRGEWRYVTPRLDFLRISGPDAAVRALSGMLDGSSSEPLDLDDEAATLLGMLAERGAVLRSDGAEAPIASIRTEQAFTTDGAAESGERTTIVGSGPVVAALSLLLDGQCAVSPDPIGEDAVLSCSVLVVCSPHLPDAEWTRLDALCERQGVAWHRCHAEGDRLIVGPMSAGGDTVSYRDYRARRRAASSQLDELDGLWRHLDGLRASASTEAWPDAGIAGMAAGLIAHDVISYLAGRTVPGGRVEVEIDCSTGETTRHPVLPLPSGIAS